MGKTTSCCGACAPLIFCFLCPDRTGDVAHAVENEPRTVGELGNIMVAEARRRKMPVVISIRLNNGYTVFQYAGDGTNLHNENWLRRKFNTVKTLEKSSLYTYMLLRKNEETMENLFLDEKEYACCGGGFPVRVEEVGVIGAILVSGLDHVSDHDFIVKCVSRYLHIDEVPRIRGDILS